MKPLRVADHFFLEQADLVGSVAVGVDLVGEHLAVPQVAVDIVLLNLLRREDRRAEQQSENNDRPECVPVVFRFQDLSGGQGVEPEQGEIQGEVGEDRAVGVAFSPVEL